MQDAKRAARITLNDTCAKNFIKSLDHRSHTFKHNEKKNMNWKFFQQEINKRKTNKLKDRHNVKIGGIEDHPYYSTFEDSASSIRHTPSDNIDHEDTLLLEYPI